mgnify:CR=1 FL=1
MVRQYMEAQENEFIHEISNKWKCVDVTSDQLGSTVIDFSDEWFAEASNLIKPTRPIRDANKFTHSGAWYDGWETRRHNEEECDWVIIKMGVASAKLVGAEVDTSFFNGNHAPFISIEALYDNNTDTDETTIKCDDTRWCEIIGKVECGPSQRHFLIRKKGITQDKFNYIKLNMYPDGGIARFKMYGKVCPEIHSSNKIIDLAYVAQGAVVTSYSDQHFGSASNLIIPGRGHDMSDGWETKRSRTEGHTDWVIIELCKQSQYIEKIIIDTAHYRGNFPQYITVHGMNSNCKDDIDALSNDWDEIIAKSKTGPDQEHSYSIDKKLEITHVKLTIIPDGGVKRIRIWGY